MTGNGDLPPKDHGVEKKPDQVQPEAAKPTAPPAPTPPADGPVGDTSVTARIEDYEKTVRLNSVVRVAFPLLSLSIIIVFLIATWLTIWGAFPEKTINTETIKAGEQLMPYFNKLIKSFTDDIAPEFIEEFELRLAEAGDNAITKLTEEINDLHTSNEQFIKDQANIAINEKQESHKKLLLELFPELAQDEERLNALAVKVNMAFKHWTISYMTRVMADYFDTMGQINDTVIKGYTAPVRAQGEGSPKVVEAEMLELFMELLNAAYDEPPVEKEKETGEPQTEAPAEAPPAPAETAPEEAKVEAPVAAPAEPAGDTPAENL